MEYEKNNYSTNKSINLKTFIISTLITVLFLHFISIIGHIMNSVDNYRQAKHVFMLNETSDDLYKAVGNFCFERGRVNVVLNDAGPVKKMEGNRAFIIARRAEGERALARALSSLRAAKKMVISEAISRITDQMPEINRLRSIVSADLAVHLNKRRRDLPRAWFMEMTKYIDSIESLLGTISQDINDRDGIISRYSALKRRTLSLRDAAGPEMSILSATILSRAPLKPELADKITGLQTVIQNQFNELKFLSRPLGNTQIPRALKELERKYYKQYIPYMKKIYSLSLRGGPYPYGQPEFLEHGVKALEEIASFMDTVVEVTRNYAESKLSESRRNIILQASLAAGSSAMILLIFLFINYRVVNPISQVTSAVFRLARKEHDVEVPNINEENEIGEMARAVDVFRETALELDKNVIALEKASAEREELIKELQETLNEIETLRGILPICSFCKNIRNDEGYYEEIESYIKHHSKADFSHTICPVCMKKHYPEEYKILKKKGKI